MKLVYVHSAALPGLAANTVHVAKMCAAFAGNGHDVTLLCPRRSSGSEGKHDVGAYYGLAHPFRVIRFPRVRVRGGTRLFALLAASFARLSGADIIYTRDISTAIVSLRLGLDVIFEAHTTFADGTMARRQFQACAGRKNFRRLVVISQALADEYLTQFPWLTGKIIVAHDGADAVPEMQSPRSAEEGFFVAYAGHLYPGKGMEVIAPLAERCAWASFHIYGGRPEDVSHWRAQLAHLGNVTFFGHLPHAELPGHLAGHDAVLAPYQRRVSISDGGKTDVSQWMSPLKLFEYMSLGLPIVCSDLPVLREILAHGETALLCAPDAVDEWEVALLRLKEERSLGRTIGRRARDEFLLRYTWMKRAETVLEGLSRDG